VQPYINVHPINSYVDGPAFRSAFDTLLAGTQQQVVSKINDALSGFSVRCQNIMIDFVPTSEEEAADLSAYIQEKSTALTDLSSSIVDKAASIVTNYVMDRPLLRETGNRSFPATISHDAPNVFSVEFSNVGSKRWTGYMTVKLVDKYKNTVDTNYPPANIPFADPGGTVTLTREVVVPKVLYVGGKPRTFGDTAKVYLSVVTRV